MKAKFLSLLFVFSIYFTANAERCGCGSMAGGSTIEYSVSDPRPGESNCCTPGTVTRDLPAMSLTWRDNGNGTYTLTSAAEYSNYNDAQTDCCRNGGAS
jgi:hypothetical protein